MRLEPYALSIHHFISSVGADAGFASIIGLAVLVLLYFAQARETASLREQAELSAQRVAMLESRIAHAVTAQPQAPSGVAPMPFAHRPGAVMAASGVQPGAQVPAAASPSPPAGVAAPPLSAATKLIPTPPVQPPFIAAPGVAAARIGGPAFARSPIPGPAPAAPAAPAPTFPGAAASAPPTAVPPTAAPPTAVPPTAVPPTAVPPGGPVGPLPPASALPANRIVTPRPATAAGGAGATNGTGDHPVVPPPVPVPSFPRRPTPKPTAPMLGDFDEGGGGRNDLARVLTVVAALAVVAAIVVVLLSLTSGGSSPKTTTAPAPVTNAPKPHRAKPKTTAAVIPASVTVAVLNGTPVAGLAKSVATQLGAGGFQQGTVANAATQTQSATSVEYATGHQRDAAAVAKALKLGASAVQPLTPDVQALACPQTTTCNVNVVVTLGADQANAQTQPAG